MTLESSLSDPDSSVRYPKRRAELDKEWAESLVLLAEGELVPWDQMDEIDLEERAERLGLDVPDDDSEE